LGGPPHAFGATLLYLSKEHPMSPGAKLAGFCLIIIIIGSALSPAERKPPVPASPEAVTHA